MLQKFETNHPIAIDELNDKTGQLGHELDDADNNETNYSDTNDHSVTNRTVHLKYNMSLVRTEVLQLFTTHKSIIQTDTSLDNDNYLGWMPNCCSTQSTGTE